MTDSIQVVWVTPQRYDIWQHQDHPLAQKFDEPVTKVLQDGLLWIWIGDTAHITGPAWIFSIFDLPDPDAMVRVGLPYRTIFGPFVIDVTEVDLEHDVITMKLIETDIWSGSEKRS